MSSWSPLRGSAGKVEVTDVTKQHGIGAKRGNTGGVRGTLLYSALVPYLLIAQYLQWEEWYVVVTRTHPGRRYTLKRFRHSLGSHLCLQEVRGRLLRAAV